jgi:hypothetical protein
MIACPVGARVGNGKNGLIEPLAAAVERKGSGSLPFPVSAPGRAVLCSRAGRRHR